MFKSSWPKEFWLQKKVIVMAPVIGGSSHCAEESRWELDFSQQFVWSFMWLLVDKETCACS